MESQRGFALQAASPRDKRLQWVTKTPMRYFTMSAWEVSELIAGYVSLDSKLLTSIIEISSRQLQSSFQQPSAAQIKEYVEKLGGSARDV